jgi:hypothetical protein
MKNVFKLGPDLGDAIAGLAVIRNLHGGVVRLFSTPGTKGWRPDMVAAILPLIRAQSYVESAEVFVEEEKLEFTRDFTGFRGSWDKGQNLITKQAAHVGLDPNACDTSPWLQVPKGDNHRKIVLCATPRHNNPAMKWFDLWRHRHADCVYIGSREEHAQFLYNHSPYSPGMRQPTTIPFHDTRDLLEAGTFLSGARALFCNQTAVLWLALGLGFPKIYQETATEDSTLGRPEVRHIRRQEDNLSMQELRIL